MQLLQAVFLTVLVACVVGGSANRPKKVPEVDQKCMECLCQASSGCDETLKCHNSGGGAYFCGPYVISWAYWHDAGRPGDKGKPHDFETCLNNKTCAEQAVRGYMRRYGRDCDRSGNIECFDFARIHKVGYGQCSSNSVLNTEYWEKFEACYIGKNKDDVGNNYGNYGNNDHIPMHYGNNDQIPMHYGNYGNNDQIPMNYGNNDQIPMNYGNNGNIPVNNDNYDHKPVNNDDSNHNPVNNDDNENTAYGYGGMLARRVYY